MTWLTQSIRSPCLEPISTKDLPAARRATWSMTANDARTGGMSWVPFGPSSSAHEMLARISFRLPVYTLTVPVKKFPPPRRVHRSSKTPLTGEPGAHSQNTSNATVHASRSVWRALTVNPGALASRSAHVGYSGTVHCKLSRGFIHSEYTQQQIMLDIPVGLDNWVHRIDHLSFSVSLSLGVRRCLTTTIL